MNVYTVRLLLIILLFPAILRGQQVDSLSRQLGDVEVKAYRIRTYLRGEPLGPLRWNMSMMDQMPQILSNADPIHYLQLLPSVQTNSEFDAGIHVQGCATGQSLTQIGDAPVYNPAHLLGFFSTFNATHYDELVFRSFGEVSTPSVLGGTVQMSPHLAPTDTLHGNLSVGLLSSQGTLRVPLARNQSLVLSGRQSYVNLLYGNFISMDEMGFDYAFGDYNLTYALSLPRHKLALNGFFSRDKGGYGQGRKDLGLDLCWQNYMASATLGSRPLHLADSVHQSLYFSGYENVTKVSQTLLEGRMPSFIRTLGYKLQMLHHLPGSKPQQLRYGLELQHHHIQPQNVDIQATFSVALQPVDMQKASQGALFAEYALQPLSWLTVKPGFRLNAYRLWNDSVATYIHPDPYLVLTLSTPASGTFNLRLNRQHQYIHQAGFSSTGLPTEFRFSSSALYKPQSALSLSLGYEHELFNRRYRLKAELYGKLLEHQIEYHGDILSFYTTGYSMDNTLVSGKGYNYGLNLQLIKQTGRLTGWVSYAYNRSMRRFETLNADAWYPSNYERPHELNAVAMYRLPCHWSFGGTFVFASGTPFTAIKYAYYLSSSLVAQYGEHNANRLAPYCRLDLSATYEFTPRRPRLRQGINLSIYNTLYNRNEVYCMLKIYEGHYSYRPITFYIRTLPSVSYYLKF